jgi:hypothetical protein
MKVFVPGFCLISIALVLLFSTLCFAQIETQRFLTPEKTSWLFFEDEYEVEYTLGFSGRKIWLCLNGGCLPFDEANYKNRLISRYNASRCRVIYGFPTITVCETVSGYTVSLFGFGKVRYCSKIDNNEERCHDSEMEKVSDDFAP